MNLENDREAFEALAGDDDAAASVVLGQLQDTLTANLEGHACARFGVSHDEAQDVVQVVFLTFWQKRRNPVFDSLAGCKAYLWRCVYNACIDKLRSAKGGRGTLVSPGPLPDDGCEGAPAWVEHGYDRVLAEAESAILKWLADTIWLGLPKSESEAVRKQRLVAAQLYFIKGLSIETAGKLAFGGPSLTSANRNRVVHWLAEPATGRYLVYSYLLLPPEKVAAIVLDPQSPPNHADMNKITMQAIAAEGACLNERAVGEWTWREVKALVLRFRFGEVDRSIAAAEWGDYTQEQLDNLFARSDTRLPFKSRMARLMDLLERPPADGCPEALASPDLWRRLVFEYGHIHKLPAKEVVAWLAPAAQLAGYKGITPANVNSLLSGHRLERKLLDEYSKLMGGRHDG